MGIHDYSWFYSWFYSCFFLNENWHSMAFGTNLSEGGLHNRWESVMRVKFAQVQTPICLEKCTLHMIQVRELCSHCR